MESPGGANYLTTYTNGANNTLQKVTQDSQTRTFYYDSLGRLTGSAQPESGAINYSYDSVGNLTSKTDSRPNGQGTKNYSYDALNQLAKIGYSDNKTYTITLGYDAAGVANSTGQLTSIFNYTATMNYTNFDVMGNVLASTEITGGGTYNFSYGYNLAGALTQEDYASGRVITTGYDGANRPDLVSGKLGGQVDYVSSTSYWPHGAPLTTVYGNTLNVVEGYFNSPLQVTGMWDVIAGNPNEFLWLEYPNWGTTNNNGNLLGNTEYAGGPARGNQLPSYSRTYTYDALNRLAGATDKTGGTTNWSRTFNYDQYGNAWVPSVVGIGWGVSTPDGNVYSGTTNQIPSSPYDAAGNISALPPGYSFTYDPENRVTIEANSSGLGASYYYDGVGDRVEKVLSNGQAIVYVYEAFGRLAEEYSPATVWSKDYVPFNGRTVAIENSTASPCTTCYLSYDYLGTPRLVTDQNANVMARHDYLPSATRSRREQQAAARNLVRTWTMSTRNSPAKSATPKR